MAHAREPITTIISLVGVALTCFVIAKLVDVACGNCRRMLRLLSL